MNLVRALNCQYPYRKLKFELLRQAFSSQSSSTLSPSLALPSPLKLPFIGCSLPPCHHPQTPLTQHNMLNPTSKPFCEWFFLPEGPIQILSVFINCIHSQILTRLNIFMPNMSQATFGCFCWNKFSAWKKSQFCNNKNR